MTPRNNESPTWRWCDAPSRQSHQAVERERNSRRPYKSLRLLERDFLTKSGDLGIILSISGVDYESLDRSEQEYAVKRLEAALKAFGPGFHVYQYLFKSNRP